MAKTQCCTGGRRQGRSCRERKTRRVVPWAGWGAEAPQGHARTIMKRDCPPDKCFLGPNKSFPVCKKGTCDVSDKGLWAAYIRAKQWGGPTKSYRGKARPRHSRRTYSKVVNKATRRLRKRRQRIGK